MNIQFSIKIGILKNILGYFLYTSGGYSEKEYAHARIYGPFVTGSTFGRNCMQFQFYYQVQKNLKISFHRLICFIF